jgi:hypothetical protein
LDDYTVALNGAALDDYRVASNGAAWEDYTVASNRDTVLRKILVMPIRGML